MNTRGIPTIGAKGIQFRSRIEAQWAEFFTLLGWEWEYEPYDLDGYIPDFILKFPHWHILVEVKGETKFENLEHHADKIIKSGYKGEFLIVGSTLGDDNHGMFLGLLGRTGHVDFHNSFEEEKIIPNYPTIKDNDHAYLAYCMECNNYIFYSLFGSYGCRYCGGSDGKEILRETVEYGKKRLIKEHLKCKSGSHDDCKCECINDYDQIEKYWSKAKNKVQWRSKK